MVAHDEGASSVEVYGFVGWIATAVGYVLYLLWAFAPEHLLVSYGITYYPDKHWAIAFPLWICLTVTFIVACYEGANLTTVPTPSCLSNIEDPSNKRRKQLGHSSYFASTEHSIPPIMHLPAAVVSRVLFGGQTVSEAEAAEEMNKSWPGKTVDSKAPPLSDLLSSSPLDEQRNAGGRTGSEQTQDFGIEPEEAKGSHRSTLTFAIPNLSDFRQ